MNKKKALMLVTSLGLIGAIGIGATLAYFTDEDSATNVVTMGKVDIELTETSEPGGTEGSEWVTGVENEMGDGFVYTDTLPLDTASKQVKVSLSEDLLGNIDSEDAHIRVRVDFESTGNPFEAEGPDAVTGVANYSEESLLDAVAASVDSTVWTRVEEAGFDYYYLIDTLTEANSSADLIASFQIPNWDNSSAGQGFAMLVKAEAVQADNFDTNADGTWVDTAVIEPAN